MYVTETSESEHIFQFQIKQQVIKIDMKHRSVVWIGQVTQDKM